jgi:hypothetical protein
MDEATRSEYHIGQDTDIVVFRDGRLDESDFKVIIEELAARDVIAEPAQPAGIASAEWIVVLEWIGNEVGQVVFTTLLMTLGPRLWRHFRQKGVIPPDRVNITYRGKTFSASLSEGELRAGEVRRLIFYGSKKDFLHFLDQLTVIGMDVYERSRIPSHLIADVGETHPFALVAVPEFDEESEKVIHALLATLRKGTGDFRIYDMDGDRNLWPENSRHES